MLVTHTEAPIRVGDFEVSGQVANWLEITAIGGEGIPNEWRVAVSDQLETGRSDVDQGTPPSTTDLAQQRTFLAAERTLFAVLRTGLAIAAGGSVIIALLGDTWPSWVQVPLAGAFLVVGYSLVLHGLRRYRGIAKNVERQAGERLEIIPARSMTVIT